MQSIKCTAPIAKSDIPIFILAGGLGTRISEETQARPKPMVEVGGIPVLLHIMRWYYAHGFNDFIICAGYKAWEIKQFFLTYEFRLNHLEIDHRGAAERDLSSLPPFGPRVFGHNAAQEKWRVRVLDTGVDAQTGTRLALAIDEIQKNTPFKICGVTYGDGLSNVDLDEELSFHLSHGKIGTLLSATPQGRFGVLEISEARRVSRFLEKPQGDSVNAGFFFFSAKIRKYLQPPCILEQEALPRLTGDGELMAFAHNGFWHPMDTLRDKLLLEDLWGRGHAPWMAVQQ